MTNAPRKRWLLWIVIGAFALVAPFISTIAGCVYFNPFGQFPSAAIEALKNDPNAVIYSLRPNHDRDLSKVGLSEQAIIGQAVVSSSKERLMLAEDISASTRGAWDAAICFLPRHAIRASGPKGTFHILLCYECGRAEVYSPDGSRREIYINGKGEVLNQYLTSRGIPLK